MEVADLGTHSPGISISDRTYESAWLTYDTGAPPLAVPPYFARAQGSRLGATPVSRITFEFALRSSGR
jgi:hypothetical protein